jgi:hypothetical protein
MRVESITKAEAEVFERVLTKLEDMSGRRRREHPLWIQMREMLDGLGHWKGVPRGKPGTVNFAGKTDDGLPSFEHGSPFD